MKHINKLFILLLVNLITLTSYSQNNNTSTEKKKRRTEIGINVTNLLNTIIDLTDNDPVEEPFDFVFKKLGYESAFRLHFGIIGNKQRDQNNIDLTTFVTNLNLKLGQEWRKNLLTRFDFIYGYDFILGYNFTSIENEGFGDDVITFTNHQLIFGPEVFLGVIFHINERLYISTQASINFLYDNNRQKVEDSSNFLPDDTEKTNGFNFQTNIPKSLHLFFKF